VTKNAEKNTLTFCFKKTYLYTTLRTTLHCVTAEKIIFTSDRKSRMIASLKNYFVGDHCQTYGGKMSEVANAVVFDQAFVNKWMPLIHKEIKRQVFGYNSSDVCYEWDDLKQECLENIWKAIPKYNPELGMKFDNFIIMVVQTRLGNFRNKISKNNFKTRNFTDISGGWAITGSEVSDEDSSSFSKTMNGHVEYDQQDLMNNLLDAKKIFEQLKDDRKKIYADYFILGKSVKEICEENPHLKYYQITRILKYLKKIHSTLVEGNTCLN
jgi:RNA polymerase sigma factor (sigma-70 family)